MIDANSNSMQSRHDGQSWCLVVSGIDSGKARVEVSEDGHGYLPQGEISSVMQERSATASNQGFGQQSTGTSSRIHRKSIAPRIKAPSGT